MEKTCCKGSWLAVEPRTAVMRTRASVDGEHTLIPEPNHNLAFLKTVSHSTDGESGQSARCSFVKRGCFINLWTEK